MDEQVIFFDIPYEHGLTLPVYLYFPHSSNRLPRKILVMVSTVGGGATQEEIYLSNPSPVSSLAMQC